MVGASNQPCACAVAHPRVRVHRTRIGTLDGQEFDLVATLSSASSVYLAPEQGSVPQATLASGFACLGVGITQSTCNNGGVLETSTITCIGEKSEIEPIGTHSPAAA
jgi:hypothetical protein